MQIGEFLGLLPNKACKGTRRRIFMGMNTQTSSSYIWDEIRLHHSLFKISLPRIEIPKWVKLNHESDGNVISFWVGRKFPNNFLVCFAFGPLKYPWSFYCHVYLSINGCKKEHLFWAPTDELSDHLWIVSLPNKRFQNQLNNSNPSERNYVEVICETTRSDMSFNGGILRDQWVAVDWIKNHPRGWGVGVECICQRDTNNADCEEETIDQPMPDVPKNTTCPTLDGFESDSDSGNGALVQPEFQLQRSCPGTFFFFYYSLSLFGKPKKRKQTSFVFCFVLFCFVFFFFWVNSRALDGNGRDRSQSFQQWSRRFRAFNRQHLCQ